MNWYANPGSDSSTRTILNVDGARTHGAANVAVATHADILAAAATFGCTEVRFCAAWMPRRPVALADVTEKMTKRFFR